MVLEVEAICEEEVVNLLKPNPYDSFSFEFFKPFHILFV
jgi:hypothetical protein